MTTAETELAGGRSNASRRGPRYYQRLRYRDNTEAARIHHHDRRHEVADQTQLEEEILDQQIRDAAEAYMNEADENEHHFVE